ncbi:MAG: hypothetical protein ABSA02_14860 [Trebonia sp.]
MPAVRKRWLLAAVTSVGLVASVVAASAPSSAAAAATTAKTSTRTPSAAVQMFADQVETLGAGKYPNSFAGARLTQAGVTDVYALPASDARLLRAIDAMNKGHYPVDVIGVSRSYNRLNEIEATVNKADKRLWKSGIRLSQSLPDPATGTVLVSVAAPVRSDISALALTVRGRVTAATYARTVAGVFRTDFGAAVKLSSTAGGTWEASGRNNDTAPFFDGDRIYGGGYTCTGGFNTTGNRSGHVFMFTAGHCPSAQWRTGSAVVGSTSTNYLGACNSEDDYQSIYVPGGGDGDVWGGSGGASLYTVVGQLLPAPGTLIAFDGSITNEVRDNTVLGINETVYNIYDSVSECFYNASPSIVAANPNGTTICQPGDSGGPVIQHTPSSFANVDAVGTIVAYFSSTGNPYGSECASTQIGSVEAETNTSLITG